MVDFKKLKQSSKELTKTLKSAVDSVNESPWMDETFWKLTVDKEGNGAAIIRFIYNQDDDGKPFAKYYSHQFKGPTGKWYAERSLTTFGETDPVGEYNRQLWNNGTSEGKKQARDQKRTLNYIANIVVINDPAKPENNGQVFKFRFGQKIFAKIESKLYPEEGFDEEPVNVFDFDEGANFRLKAKAVKAPDGNGSYRSYDLSTFDAPSPLFGGDEQKQQEAFESTYSLVEFKDRKYYKSYDELKQELASVMGWNERNSPGPSTVEREVSKSEEPEPRSHKLEDGFDDDGDDLGKYSKFTQSDDDVLDDDIPF